MKNKQNLILTLLLICYSFLGLSYSSHQGFWHDEIYTLTFLKGISAYTFKESTLSTFTQAIPIQYCKNLLQSDHFITNLKVQILHEGHPPLYFLFLKVWAIFFGYSEIALRSFSLVSGLLSVVTIYSLFKDNFKQNYIAWIIVLIILFNPFLFYYFTEARMYSLAFLLAVLVFKYWLKYLTQKKYKSYDYLWFLLASIALLYTHYYGIFFFFILIFWDVFKFGINIKLFNYIVPLVIFAPWTYVIKTQTHLHQIHWTDGSYTFLVSLIGYGNALISLFFSPMSNATKIDSIFAIIVSLALIYFIANTWKWRFIYIGIAFLYFLQIFLFDKVLNHHTIVVSRYLIFILIFFYWATAKSILNTPLKFSISLTIIYCIVAGINFYHIYTLQLAPKQMFKELAGYINARHDPINTVIVVEPAGPAIWGLSYYLDSNFYIVSAEYSKTIDPSKRKIYVDEMLGDTYWEGHLNNKEQSNLKLVPFVGLFLYE